MPIRSSKPMKAQSYSIEAEQCLLGAIIQNNQATALVENEVAVDHFYHLGHRLIYEAVLQLAAEDEPFTPVNLAEYLEKKGQLEYVGGLVYISDLCQNAPDAENLGAYARIIYDYAVFRQLVNPN